MPQHVPTAASRSQVRALAGYGMDTASIGVLLGISADAVREHYARELAAGPAEARVREALHRKALAGDRMALRMLRKA